MNTANRSPGYVLKKKLQESKVEFPVEVIIISAFYTVCRFIQGPKNT